MSELSREALKLLFRTGAKPDQGEFESVFDSFLNPSDDPLKIYDSSRIGIGTNIPRAPLGIRAEGDYETAMSLEDPAGGEVWSMKLNTGGGGDKRGLNIAESGVAEARLFLAEGGRVGIGSPNPEARFHVEGDEGADTLALFSDSGEFGLRVVSNTDEDGTDKIGIQTEVQGNGNSHGVYGQASGTGSYNYAVRGAAEGAASINYGIHGRAADANHNYGLRAIGYGGSYAYGVYASASGGSLLNYAMRSQGSMYVAGNVNYTGASQYVSDKAVKKNIKGMKGKLADVLRLKPSEYEYKRTNASWKSLNLPEGKSVGFLAQDMEEVFPELVTMLDVPPTPEEIEAAAKKGKTLEPLSVKSINYNGLLPMLTVALQEQNQLITALEDRIQVLEAGGSVATKPSSKTSMPLETRVMMMQKALNRMPAYKRALEDAKKASKKSGEK